MGAESQEDPGARHGANQVQYGQYMSTESRERSGVKHEGDLAWRAQH
jgi:hypothetical protein